MVEKLFEEISGLCEVESIAPGGSRSGTNYDEKSGYDVYVYCLSPIPEKSRSCGAQHFHNYSRAEKAAVKCELP